ncbi:MAG TPA: ABC transporter ATP-binding protein [Minicystis sp.]|nr:ABC transporter ATP-binding protein [Minicystis sp.]
MADPLLSITGVTKAYGDRVRTLALAGVDLTLDGGELVALVGPSGSGKSTLLNVIGLLDRPTAGRVVLAGEDATGLDERRASALRARALGFVFQFHHLLPAFTALENVMLPGWGDVGVPTQELHDRALELLDAVGLAARARAKPTELSGGQQQRVAIARALSRAPPLVLADEPTGNLDTESANDVLALMRRFNRERGTTFLVVTHDAHIAASCARVIEMVDGRIRSDTARAVPREPPSRG